MIVQFGEKQTQPTATFTLGNIKKATWRQGPDGRRQGTCIVGDMMQAVEVDKIEFAGMGQKIFDNFALNKVHPGLAVQGRGDFQFVLRQVDGHDI